MTQDEINRERRAFWDACCAEATEHFCDEHANSDPIAMAEFAALLADAKLAERDKRGWLGCK